MRDMSLTYCKLHGQEKPQQCRPAQVPLELDPRVPWADLIKTFWATVDETGESGWEVLAVVVGRGRVDRNLTVVWYFRGFVMKRHAEVYIVLQLLVRLWIFHLKRFKLLHTAPRLWKCPTWFHYVKFPKWGSDSFSLPRLLMSFTCFAV